MLPGAVTIALVQWPTHKQAFSFRVVVPFLRVDPFSLDISRKRNLLIAPFVFSPLVIWFCVPPSCHLILCFPLLSSEERQPWRLHALTNSVLRANLDDNWWKMGRRWALAKPYSGICCAPERKYLLYIDMGGGAGADFAPNLRRETISLTHLPPLGTKMSLSHPPPSTWKTRSSTLSKSENMSRIRNRACAVNLTKGKSWSGRCVRYVWTRDRNMGIGPILLGIGPEVQTGRNWLQRNLWAGERVGTSPVLLTLPPPPSSTMIYFPCELFCPQTVLHFLSFVPNSFQIQLFSWIISNFNW